MSETSPAPRERILALVVSEPGLHLRELPRRLELSLRTVRHHLTSLEREHLVRRHPAGRFVRFFPGDGFDDGERALISALRSRVQRDVLWLLLREEYGRFGRLRDRLRLSPATLSANLRLLEGSGLVAADGGRYRLTDPAAVRMHLALYRSRFPDLLADAASEIFDEV